MTSTSRFRLPGLSAAALSAVLTLPTVLIAHDRNTAMNSELRITSGPAVAGARLTVEYRANDRLATHADLLVRARYRTENSGPNAYHATVGQLRRDGVTYKGIVQLPDSAVFAVLAVQDRAAETVDDHGETWEVVVHGRDGRPLADALDQKGHDAMMRNTRISLEAAREMVRLYPNNPDGWRTAFSLESQSLSKAATDSLREVFRARLPQLEQALLSAGPSELSSFVFFAGNLQDSATERRIEDRLIAEFPKSGAAVQRRVFRIQKQHGRNPDAYLAALDSLFDEVGAVSAQLNNNGLQAAQTSKNPDAVRRWGERVIHAEPLGFIAAAYAYLPLPELRDEGIALLRRTISEVGHETWMERRPLTMNAAEFGQVRDRILANHLTRLGETLLARGDVDEALAALREAGKSGWNPARFRSIAEILHQRGEHAEATTLYARVVADPSTRPALADSIRTLVGAQPDWESQLAAARTQMLEHYRSIALSMAPLRESMTLTRLDGSAEQFSLKTGQPTLIAFWSRYCMPSRMQLAQLNAIAARAKAQGFRVITVTDEEPNPELLAFVEKEKLTVPVYLDVDRDARNAFDNHATPRYILIDSKGMIRFSDYSLDDLMTRMLVVQ